MTYYQILEVEQAAPTEIIKKRYMAKAVVLHPDKARLASAGFVFGNSDSSMKSVMCYLSTINHPL